MVIARDTRRIKRGITKGGGTSSVHSCPFDTGIFFLCSVPQAQIIHQDPYYATTTTTAAAADTEAANACQRIVERRRYGARHKFRGFLRRVTRATVVVATQDNAQGDAERPSPHVLFCGEFVVARNGNCGQCAIRAHGQSHRYARLPKPFVAVRVHIRHVFATTRHAYGASASATIPGKSWSPRRVVIVPPYATDSRVHP